MPVLTTFFYNNSHPNRPTVIKKSQTSVRLAHTNLTPLANQAPRVPTTTSLTALGVGPLPTLAANRAVALPRPPAAATLLEANQAARVSLPPATLALTAGVRIGVQLPTTPRPHLPCVTLQSLQKSL